MIVEVITQPTPRLQEKIERVTADHRTFGVSRSG
jgi:hypothetical protein